MDSVISGLIFFILGALSFYSGLSASAWKREGTPYRIGALVVGLVFMIMGILALFGYIEIKDGS